jgi:hypothetical protein
MHVNIYHMGLARRWLSRVCSVEHLEHVHSLSALVNTGASQLSACWCTAGVNQLIQQARRNADTGGSESSAFILVQAQISLKIAGRTKTHYLTLHLPRDAEHSPSGESPVNTPSASASSPPGKAADPALRRSARHMARANMSSDATPDPARGASTATSMSGDQREGEKLRPRVVTGASGKGGGPPWGPNYQWWPMEQGEGRLGEWEHPLHLWFGVEAFLTLGFETPYGEVPNAQVRCLGLVLPLTWPCACR